VTFGNLAILVLQKRTVDPWLCVAGFRRVCLFRMSCGHINIKFRDDSLQTNFNQSSVAVTNLCFAFANGLNVHGTFTSTIINRENIGKTSEEFVAKWNEEFPDD
jgi:hypothetical protein